MTGGVAVRLSNGGLMLVDWNDVSRVMQHRWYARRPQVRNHTTYAGTTMHIAGRWCTVLAHRWLIDAPLGMRVDHINGNGLDNRRANLRLVTQSQNLQNRRGARSGTRSGIRGVSWSSNGWWAVHAHVNGMHYRAGRFQSLEEAERAAKELRARVMTHSAENRRGR
jgi:hypothetical protein